MLSRLASAAKNSKFFSVAQELSFKHKELSFKDKVDVCMVSVVVGVSMVCSYKVGMDYYDLAKPVEIVKQN